MKDEKTYKIGVKRGTDLVRTEITVGKGETEADAIRKAEKVAEQYSGGYKGWSLYNIREVK